MDSFGSLIFTPIHDFWYSFDGLIPSDILEALTVVLSILLVYLFVRFFLKLCRAGKVIRYMDILVLIILILVCVRFIGIEITLNKVVEVVGS